MPEFSAPVKLGNREIASLHASRELPESMRQCCVWLHDIRSMHNVGSVFRTCDAFGIGSLILSGFTPTPPRPEISKAALGADEFVPWLHFDTKESVLEKLTKENYALCAIEQTKASRSILQLRYLNPAQKVCFLFGNEVQGIEDALLAQCNHFFEIPQFGQKHSLNVSVSAGVVLFQYLSGLLPDSEHV